MSSSNPESLALEDLRITTFDPHICAKLYNELVDHTLALGSEIFSRSMPLTIPNDLPFRHPQFPDDSITDHLSSSLGTFLQECKLFTTYAPDACLLPFVQPLDPKTFWMYQDWRSLEHNPTAICLFAEAPYMDEGGLFFDQETGLARYIRFPWPEQEHGHYWMPLELILRKWLKIWELGQICLDYDGEDPTDPNWSGIFKLGWNGDSLCSLDHTSSAWDELLDAIVARMPSDAFATSATDSSIGLLSRVVVHEDAGSGIPHAYTFAKNFF